MAVPRSPAVEGMGWGRAAWMGRTRVRGSLDKALQAPGHPSPVKTCGGGKGRPLSTSVEGHRDAGLGRGLRSRQDTTATPGTLGWMLFSLTLRVPGIDPRQKVHGGAWWGGVWWFPLGACTQGRGWSQCCQVGRSLKSQAQSLVGLEGPGFGGAERGLGSAR